MTGPKIGYVPVHLLDQKAERHLDGIQGGQGGHDKAWEGHKNVQLQPT